MADLEARLQTFEGSNPGHGATPSSQPASENRVDETTPGDVESLESGGVTHFEALQVDDGHLTFHGATSFFQLPKSRQDDGGETMLSAPTVDVEGRGKDKLINSAWKERAFEQLANIPEPMKTLLLNHWTWVSPLFNFVYRPAFTRDMKSQGPYYSTALYNTVLAHSVRWAKADPTMAKLLEPYDGGAHFYRQAIAAIFEDVKHGPGKVPDIQALLLLSAQSIGRGHKTQAWLYMGMAIRLVEDMGLDIDSRSYAATAGLTDEDIEIRNRLFWSCYAWEKLLCLYLGRQPSISNTHASPPQLLLDDSAEIEIWSPSGIGVSDSNVYPPTQSHATSCFMSMCSLSEILHRILTQLYDPRRPRSEEVMMSYVVKEEANLQHWWGRLPDYLRISDADLPAYCPPSHIATLNAMFHMVKIQLHRPVLCARGVSQELRGQLEHHVLECTSSANAIINIFDLYTRTFGMGFVMTALIYSLYAAASIFLLQIQAANQNPSGSTSRLKYCINALESVKSSAPIINTAVKLIQREIERVNVSIYQSPNNLQQSLELPRMVSEEPSTYEWTSLGPESSLLPPQWATFGTWDEPDTIFDDDFSLAVDMNPSYFTQGFSEAT